MPDEENPKELDELRQKSLHEREATQDERKKIERRRREIEQRRQVLSHSGNDSALKELLDLQLEIVKLQEHIVELQLESDHQREYFAALKKRANGIWHDLSMSPEESLVRLETIQGFAEAIQKLHEVLQEQEEGYDKKGRAENKAVDKV
jgi:hypothetical protein